jgi:hypothetical protein
MPKWFKLDETIGKTVAGVVVTKASTKRRPDTQIFFEFTDGTHTEIWGEPYMGATYAFPGGRDAILRNLGRKYEVVHAAPSRPSPARGPGGGPGREASSPYPRRKDRPDGRRPGGWSVRVASGQPPTVYQTAHGTDVATVCGEGVLAMIHALLIAKVPSLLGAVAEAKQVFSAMAEHGEGRERDLGLDMLPVMEAALFFGPEGVVGEASVDDPPACEAG